jgi:hypothetical protein
MSSCPCQPEAAIPESQTPAMPTTVNGSVLCPYAGTKTGGERHENR